MAQFEPEVIQGAKTEITEEGLKLNITLPPKKFSSGNDGFFKQGVAMVNGVKYRLNLQVYKTKDQK